MLVQVSPWQTNATSLAVTDKSRRTPRKNCVKSSSSPLTSACVTNELCSNVAASFVTSMKRHRGGRGRQASEKDFFPQVVLTSMHKISVVGRLRNQEDSIQESPELLFNGRPGNTRAFLSKTKAQIPVVLNDKVDIMYGLQNDNKTILKWPTASNDVEENSTKVELPSPAASLDFFKDIIYGTLQDGSLYFHQQDKLVVIPFPMKSLDSTSIRHVNTMIKTLTDLSKTKRKADIVLRLAQTFVTPKGFLIIRHKLTFQEGFLACETTEVSEIASANELATKNGWGSLVDVDTLLVVFEEDDCSSKPLPNIIKGNSQIIPPLKKAVLLSLESGRALSAPFDLSSFTRNIGMVGPNILAVGAIDEIVLYDVWRGAIIDSINIFDVVQADCKDWMLLADLSKNRLAVMYSDDKGIVHISCAIVQASNERDLVSGLRMAVKAERPDELIEPPSDLLQLMKSDLKRKVESSTATSVLLERIHTALGQVLDPNKSKISNHLLLETFNECMPVSTSVEPPKKKRKKNGVTNGHHNHSEAVASADKKKYNSVSAEFVDGVMPLILSTMLLPKCETKEDQLTTQCAKADARTILFRLLATKKVSSRRHFHWVTSHHTGEKANALLAVLLSMGSEDGRRRHSPVKLIHRMITYCSDITERQMVTMIHYMMVHARPEDLVDVFLKAKYLGSKHPFIKSSERFVKASKKERTETELKSGDQAAVMKEKIDSSVKVVQAGTVFLMRRLVQYSSFNESLLRTAVADELPTSNEPRILAKVLVQILEDGFDLGDSVMKWLFAICESCKIHLTNSDMDIIRVHVKKTLQCSESIINIMASMDAIHAREKMYKQAGRAVPRRDVRRAVSEGNGKGTSGYTIEQLTF